MLACARPLVRGRIFNIGWCFGGICAAPNLSGPAFDRPTREGPRADVHRPTAGRLRPAGNQVDRILHALGGTKRLFAPREATKTPPRLLIDRPKNRAPERLANASYLVRLNEHCCAEQFFEATWPWRSGGRESNEPSYVCTHGAPRTGKGRGRLPTRRRRPTRSRLAAPSMEPTSFRARRANVMFHPRRGTWGWVVGHSYIVYVRRR